jgi:hypothetical protein
MNEGNETLADSLKELLEEARQVQRDTPIRYNDLIKQRVAEMITEKFRKQGLNIRLNITQYDPKEL